MSKTICRFNWKDGYIKQRTLSRSFDTLEEAQMFAKGKNIVDIYASKGKYKVEWIKVINNNLEVNA